jgi:hypothetical protein
MVFLQFQLDLSYIYIISMKLTMWRVVGSAFLMVALACIMANAQVVPTGYSQYKIAQSSGRSFLIVPDAPSCSTWVELDGSKFAEYMMAVVSMSVPLYSEYKFNKIRNNNRRGIKVIFGYSPQWNPTWVDIYTNFTTPLGTPADVAIHWMNPKDAQE